MTALRVAVAVASVIAFAYGCAPPPSPKAAKAVTCASAITTTTASASASTSTCGDPPADNKSSSSSEDGAFGGADVDRDENMDYGDGAVSIRYDAANRSVSVGGYAPIILDVDVACWHVTGFAGLYDGKPPVFVVVSPYGSQKCGTMLGLSRIYRFDGAVWLHVMDSVGSELHIRSDGPDVIEWKLVSAEEGTNSGPWTRMPKKAFPPTKPKADDMHPYGFRKPPPPVPNLNP